MVPRTSVILLIPNVLLFVVLIVINKTLKVDIEALNNQQLMSVPVQKEDSAESSNSVGTIQAAIPLQSNINRIVMLLVDLAKIYFHTIQVQKIEYSLVSNIADVSIKSYELKNLDRYLNTLDVILKKENASIVQINILDKNNKQVVPENNEAATRSREVIPFVLAYLKARQASAAQQEEKQEDNDQNYKYKVNIKINL